MASGSLPDGWVVFGSLNENELAELQNAFMGPYGEFLFSLDMKDDDQTISLGLPPIAVSTPAATPVRPFINWAVDPIVERDEDDEPPPAVPPPFQSAAHYPVVIVVDDDEEPPARPKPKSPRALRRVLRELESDLGPKWEKKNNVSFY